MKNKRIIFFISSKVWWPNIHTYNFSKEININEKIIYNSFLKFMLNIILWKHNNDIIYFQNYERLLIIYILNLINIFFKWKYIYMCHWFLFKEIEIWLNPIKKFINNKYIFFIYKKMFIYIMKNKDLKIYSVSNVIKNYLIQNWVKNKIYVFYPTINTKNYISRVRNTISNDKLLFIWGTDDHKWYNLLLNLVENSNLEVDIYWKILDSKKINNKNIRYLWFSKNIWKLFDNYDILLYPSLLDNLPTAIIEALYSWIIILSTPVWELKNILLDWYNSYVINDFRNTLIIEEIINNIYYKDNSTISENAIKSFNREFNINNFFLLLEDIKKYQET